MICYHLCFGSLSWFVAAVHFTVKVYFSSFRSQNQSSSLQGIMKNLSDVEMYIVYSMCGCVRCEHLYCTWTHRFYKCTPLQNLTDTNKIESATISTSALQNAVPLCALGFSCCWGHRITPGLWLPNADRAMLRQWQQAPSPATPCYINVYFAVHKEKLWTLHRTFYRAVFCKLFHLTNLVNHQCELCRHFDHCFTIIWEIWEIDLSWVGSYPSRISLHRPCRSSWENWWAPNEIIHHGRRSNSGEAQYLVLTIAISSFVWVAHEKHQLRDLGQNENKFAPQIVKIKPIFCPYEWRELCTDMALSENRIPQNLLDL